MQLENLTENEQKIINNFLNIKNIDKNNFNMWSTIQQIENDTKEGKISILTFRKNHFKTYCVIEINQLLDLLYKK